MGSSFGDLFRISTFGESHGGGVGVIVDGCPPRLALDLEAIQAELDRFEVLCWFCYSTYSRGVC